MLAFGLSEENITLLESLEDSELRHHEALSRAGFLPDEIIKMTTDEIRENLLLAMCLDSK